MNKMDLYLVARSGVARLGLSKDSKVSRDHVDAEFFGCRQKVVSKTCLAQVRQWTSHSDCCTFPNDWNVSM